ncbi:MAG: STAS domain-containing protein [Planctomycetota bacterium]|nr:MAG: STAS domain-containing protein [Planctomycetota bacterium]
MSTKVNIETTREGKVTLVVFKAASISNVDEIAAICNKIKEFIEESRPNKMVVDFQKVKFFSSQVLAVLLDIRAKLKAYDGEVVISAINPQLHRIFKITNLDKLFKFFPDRESAIRVISPD